MHAQCCFLWYSQTRLWSSQCALKAADHLVRAFSSVSAHSKAFLSYTNYDSCGLNSQRRQNEFTGKLNRCKDQREKAGKETTKWNLILWSQGRFLLSLIRVSKDWNQRKTPKEEAFPLLPSKYLSLHSSLLEFTGTRTLSTHSQISKASAKFPSACHSSRDTI